jgi:two-component system sensor histidine kinase UhpB
VSDDGKWSTHGLAIISTTSTGTIIGFNQAAEHLLGFRAEEVIGKRTPADFHDAVELKNRTRSVPSEPSVVTDRFRAIVAGIRLGDTAEADWTYIHRNGRRLIVHLSITALPDAFGETAGFVFALQDNRGTVEAEELLRRQAELLDLANDAIFVRDLERDTVTYWNDGAVRLYGWTNREADGAYIHEFLRTVFPKPLEEIKREFLAKGHWAGELIHTTRNGDRITVSSRWTLLRDASGVPKGSLELNTDITEQKRVQDVLKATHEELECRVMERTAALSEANARLRVLSSRLMEIQESERRAIARDLHDEIGQALTAIKLNLRELGQSPKLSTDTAAEKQIIDSLEILDQVLQHIRNLALDLRPSMLDELGLVPALRWYAGRQAERAGWELNFQADGILTRPSPSVEISCFRLTQEALTNVARHAEAKKVSVRLEMRGRELDVVIRDDGKGFDPHRIREGAHAGSTVGLSGMEERVRLLGGQISVTSAHDAGTEIHATFPVGRNPDEAEYEHE